MKGVNGKQIFTYVIIFAILGVVAAYFLGYKKNIEKATNLETTNAELKERVKSLEGYYNEQKVHLDAMEETKPKIKTILSKYAPDVKEEDQIMQAVASHNWAEVQYENINLANREEMLFIPADIVKGAGMEEYQNDIAFMKKTATYKNILDYEGLCDLIECVFMSNYDIGLKGISYVKGETTESKLFGMIDEETGEIVYVTDKKMDQKVGVLNGNIDLEFYYVSGNGEEYYRPNMQLYERGTEDFFALYDPEEEEEEEE